MDMNFALQLLLTLAALITYSTEGKSLRVCRKSLRRLSKRQTFLDGSAVFPQNEERDMGCVDYEINSTVTPQPAPNLPMRWVYYPHPVAIYLPKNNTYVWPHAWTRLLPGNFNLSKIINSTQRQPQLRPVVIHGRTLRPMNNVPPELEAFLRGNRVGQGGVAPQGAQLVVVRPVNMIQLPRRGMSDLLNLAGRMPEFQKGGGFVKGPDVASSWPALHTPPRPPLLFGRVYGYKLPYNAYAKSST
ncbi:uncharacterized protein [Salminus brasiliensis]|uniref:uncharacterized protein n=1 Tax=Salminus brasiliensis TaxID=930266 RepID=UPI003B835F69